jgi:hypothetical protein
MNPRVPQAVIDSSMERDPSSAAAEYLAEFRSDMNFIKPDEVTRCVTTGVLDRLPLSSRRYKALVVLRCKRAIFHKQQPADGQACRWHCRGYQSRQAAQV